MTELELPGHVQKLVVVRASNIGDFVCITPALRALRRRFPSAEITLIGSDAWRSLAERFPASIDRFLAFPGFPGIRERDVLPSATVRFLAAAQRERFDVAVQMHGNGVWSNPFTVLLDARFTVGFRREEDSGHFLGLDRSLVYDEDRHELLRALDLVGLLGAPMDDTRLSIELRPEDHAQAARLLANADVGGPLVALHPVSRVPDRTWPQERWAALAASLLEAGARIVVTGGPDDRITTGPLVDALADHHPRVIDATGQLSLPGLAALLARLDLFIAGDTGPAHLAYATDTPSVTIFGAADPRQWSALDRRRHRVVEAARACHPCGGKPCIGRSRLRPSRERRSTCSPRIAPSRPSRAEASRPGRHRTRVAVPWPSPNVRCPRAGGNPT